MAIAPCPGYDSDVTAALREAWRQAGAPDLHGRRVILKPNLVSYIAGPPGNTHPKVVEAAITVCRELGAAEVLVAEGTAFVRDVAPLLQMTGLADTLSRSGARFVDLNYDDLDGGRSAGRIRPSRITITSQNASSGRLRDLDAED